MSLISVLDARVLRQPEKLRVGSVFLTAGRLATLRTRLGAFDSAGMVSTDDPRINYEWNVRIMGRPLTYMPVGPISPWHIDEHYGSDGSSNAEQLNIVNADFEAAVDFAYRYRVTGNLQAGAASVRILSAWARISSFDTNAGSVLNWNDKWPLMIQAALLVKKHPAYTPAIHAALQDVTRRGLDINTATTHNNNWAAWGCCYLFAAGIFLNDPALFERGLMRWRTLIDSTVVNNIPIEEVYRQGAGQGNGSYGLWYSNFFLDGLTVAAEWARFGGAWLYDYVGADGSTFKQLALNVRYWTRNPTLFPYNTSGNPSETVRIMAHDDILHALWPDADSQWLLDTFTTGSVRDNFGIRQAVLTYRDRPLYG